MFVALLSVLLAVPQGAQAASGVIQDLNCNGVEVEEEPPVDLADPVCAENLGQEGNPFPNADYYVGYDWFGCAYPVIPTLADPSLPNFDIDEDN